MKNKLSKKDAILKLYELKESIELYKKNTFGRAGLVRDIRESLRFIKQFQIEESTIFLIVSEKQNKVDKFILDKTNKGKG